ncbi:hypothetical protein PTTG_28671 [Puccinia triticina 1-1 BBBD Race 1]|uniref:Uncharacterized protein n=1 Tax=Puccinia triticina (isolate 1-1 / race 1 (BBBD)) TaxID=630390 RepID=A0A180G9Z2_PUCT1|nr:hypothetical protein PTTG_28671 [Puccinia triticina 1-1 BBBD Race 1]
MLVFITPRLEKFLEAERMALPTQSAGLSWHDPGHLPCLLVPEKVPTPKSNTLSLSSWISNSSPTSQLQLNEAGRRLTMSQFLDLCNFEPDDPLPRGLIKLAHIGRWDFFLDTSDTQLRQLNFPPAVASHLMKGARWLIPTHAISPTPAEYIPPVAPKGTQDPLVLPKIGAPQGPVMPRVAPLPAAKEPAIALPETIGAPQAMSHDTPPPPPRPEPLLKAQPTPRLPPRPPQQEPLLRAPLAQTLSHPLVALCGPKPNHLRRSDLGYSGLTKSGTRPVSRDRNEEPPFEHK